MKLPSSTTSATADTLNGIYSDRWDGVGGADENAIIQFMSSNDLIFVVLAVSLIIWFVLVFYLIKMDRKVSKLEEKLLQTNNQNKEL